MKGKHHLPVPDGFMEIFRPYITLPDGRRIYAWQYGIRAFRLLVREE